MFEKNDGFKTSFKRIKETGRTSRLGRRLLERHTVGISIQFGENNANGSVQPKSQVSVSFTTIEEVIRFKSSKVADGETGS